MSNQIPMHPNNRLGYKYTWASAWSPHNESTSTICYKESQSFDPLISNLSLIDRNPAIILDSTQVNASSNKGWASARGVHGVKSGNWYFETKIICGGDIDAKAHVRIGFSRREAFLDWGVGSDEFGYAYRDVSGEVFTNARPKSYGLPFKTGDVIGCMISFGEAPEKLNISTKMDVINVPLHSVGLPVVSRCESENSEIQFLEEEKSKRIIESLSLNVDPAKKRQKFNDSFSHFDIRSSTIPPSQSIDPIKITELHHSNSMHKPNEQVKKLPLTFFDKLIHQLKEHPNQIYNQAKQYLNDNWPLNQTLDKRVVIKYKGSLFFESRDYAHYDQKIIKESVKQPALSESKNKFKNGKPMKPPLDYQSMRHYEQEFKKVTQVFPCDSVSRIPRMIGSKIQFFLNGKCQGDAFTDIAAPISSAFLIPPNKRKPKEAYMPTPPIYDDGTLGYYPTLSLFKNGRAQVNFGLPECKPETDLKYRVFNERGIERDVEYVMNDLLNEVESFVLGVGLVKSVVVREVDTHVVDD